jgi:hypothetical protein
MDSNLSLLFCLISLAGFLLNLTTLTLVVKNFNVRVHVFLVSSF